MVILESLRRWLGHKGMTPSHWSELQHWAEERKFDLRRARGSEGFAIDGRQGSVPWRMEWGEAQRSYVNGFELRLRAEAGLAPELQVALMNARLRDQLQAQAFDPVAAKALGAVDGQTPPEVRWLVSYQALGRTQLRQLADRWAAVSNVSEWAELWLSGPLAADLDVLECHPELPVLVLIARGRCTLRVGLTHPHVGAIEPWLRLFESCVREAQRTGHAGCASDQGEVTQPGMFVPSASVDVEHVSLS